MREILFTEEAGIIRYDAVDSCAQRPGEGGLVLDRPGENGRPTRVAALDEPR